MHNKTKLILGPRPVRASLPFPAARATNVQCSERAVYSTVQHSLALRPSVKAVRVRTPEGRRRRGRRARQRQVEGSRHGKRESTFLRTHAHSLALPFGFDFGLARSPLPSLRRRRRARRASRLPPRDLPSVLGWARLDRVSYTNCLTIIEGCCNKYSYCDPKSQIGVRFGAARYSSRQTPRRGRGDGRRRGGRRCALGGALPPSPLSLPFLSARLALLPPSLQSGVRVRPLPQSRGPHTLAA